MTRDEMREVVARALIVDQCCEECEPDWAGWLPTADAVLDALGLEQIGWWLDPGNDEPGDGLHACSRFHVDADQCEPVYRLRGKS